MATKELDILMQHKDENGDIEIHYPITHIGNVVGLQEKITELNSDLAEEIRQLGESVADGKKIVAAAISGKGVATQPDATFETMSNNILNMPTGIMDILGTKESFTVDAGKSIQAGQFVSYMRGFSNLAPQYTQSGLKKVNTIDPSIGQKSAVSYMFHSCKLNTDLYIISYQSVYSEEYDYGESTRYCARINYRVVKVNGTTLTFGAEYPGEHKGFGTVRYWLDWFQLRKLSTTAAFVCRNKTTESSTSSSRTHYYNVQQLTVNTSTLAITFSTIMSFSGSNDAYYMTGAMGASANIENGRSLLVYYYDLNSSNSYLTASVVTSGAVSTRAGFSNYSYHASPYYSDAVCYSTNRVMLAGARSSSKLSVNLFDVTGTSVTNLLYTQIDNTTVSGNKFNLFKLTNNQVVQVWEYASTTYIRILIINGTNITTNSTYTVATTATNWTVCEYIVGSVYAVSYYSNSLLYTKLVKISSDRVITIGSAVQISSTALSGLTSSNLSEGKIQISGYDSGSNMHTNILTSPVNDIAVPYNSSLGTFGISHSSGTAGQTIQVTHP